VIGLDAASPTTAHVKVLLDSAGGDTSTVTGSTVVGDGTWHYIASTFTSGSENLYVDGKLDGSATGNFSIANSAGVALALGAWNGGGGSYSTSAMSDFQVFDTVLSQAQIDFNMTLPEPSSYVALAGLGAMGLLLVARRRKNQPATGK
jgi:hypothetical protein